MSAPGDVCPRQCLHVLHTVSESMLHKDVVQLMSTPGAFHVYSLLFGFLNHVLVTISPFLSQKSISIWPLWFRLPIPCDPTVFLFLTYRRLITITHSLKTNKLFYSDLIFCNWVDIFQSEVCTRIFALGSIGVLAVLMVNEWYKIKKKGMLFSSRKLFCLFYWAQAQACFRSTKV